LDLAANVTAGANSPAPDDAMDVERKRAANWPHWPNRGDGPTRRDRLERRLFRDSEREAELAQAHETIRRIEEAADAKAAEVERLEQELARVEHDAAPEPEPEPDPEPAVIGDFLLFAWAPHGYALHQGCGDPPAVGSRLLVNGHDYAVSKLARSPLPGDERRCAYLEPL
jgi:hypothetical protein